MEGMAKELVIIDIDILIDKYTKEINKCDCDTCRACQTYHKVIDDLKKLRGGTLNEK